MDMRGRCECEGAGNRGWTAAGLACFANSVSRGEGILPSPAGVGKYARGENQGTLDGRALHRTPVHPR